MVGEAREEEEGRGGKTEEGERENAQVDNRISTWERDGSLV